MNKEDYQKLYQEYQELKKKTEVNVYTKEVGKDCHLQHIEAGDMNELNKVKQQLKPYLEFLTDEKLIEISEDDSELKTEAEKILEKRRRMR